MTEYTKWAVDTFDYYYVLDSSGIAIAQMMGNERSNQAVLRARARLIAAAPTMYEFIVRIAAGDCCQTEGCCLDDPSCDVMEARAIIAKVEEEQWKSS